ncbi:MAG: hypothetical protein ACYTHJ_20930 [Planctomycetota bacterium]|jgi:type II secretory pathway pseudopilin PulG
MYKSFTGNSLRASRRHRSSRRTAFSLAELVVSVGVLVLLLAMAGQVMSLTVTATGQAQALAEVNQQLRILEQTLRSDLARIDRDNALMLIKSHAINAYWTADGRDADGNSNPLDGYPHGVDRERSNPVNPEFLIPPRADILMFFTEREATSNIHPSVRSGLQQVVYGHAEFGEYTPEGLFTDLDRIEQYPEDASTYFSIPAERWLLARRSVLLSPTVPPSTSDALVNSPLLTALDDERLLRGETDVIEGFDYENNVLTPSPNSSRPHYLPPIFAPGDQGNTRPYARSLVDPQPPLNLANAINQHFLQNCASFKVEWCLDPKSDLVGNSLDFENKVHWIDQGAYTDPEEPAPTSFYPQLKSLYDALGDATSYGLEHGAERQNRLSELVYGTRGIIDAESVYALEDRFGNAGSPWNTFETWLEWPTDAASRRANYAVFTARRGDPGEYVDEDVFPRALRITVDVYDSQRRLDKPIRHVMILPVGQL